MNIRAASLVLAFTFAALPAHAQNPGGGPPAGSGETIKSLARNLAAVTARVAKLESGQVDASDLVGNYAVYALGIELHGGFPAQIASETSGGTVTLNADGSGSGIVKDARWDLRQGMPWSLTYSESPFSGSFSWTVANGTLVIPGDEDAALTIGAGGRLLIGGGTSTNGGWSNLFMLIRLPNQ